MKISNLIHKIITWPDKFFAKAVKLQKESIENGSFEKKLKNTKSKYRHYNSDSPIIETKCMLDWCVFEKPISISQKFFYKNIFPSRPNFFFKKSDKILKILLFKKKIEINAISTIIVFGIVTYTIVTVLSLILTGYSFLWYSNPIVSLVSISLLLPFFIIFFGITVDQKSITLPYLIFDYTRQCLVLRGEREDEIIPYQENRIRFDVLPIRNSPAYCAIEMNIDYSSPEKPTQKILLDFCESHFHAQTLLKTYLGLISGKKDIYDKKLKKHRASMREFYLPFFKSITHIWRIYYDYLFRLRDYKWAFHLIHGSPESVLKKYIIEQEYATMPRSIANNHP